MHFHSTAPTASVIELVLEALGNANANQALVLLKLRHLTVVPVAQLHDFAWFMEENIVK